MDLARLARVAVVGTSCSGKTTFGRAVSRILGIPHTELDALYWGPEWQPRDPEEFRSHVQAAVASPAWVIDGNYSMVRDLVWGRATALVWLNYSFRLVFSRAVVRSVGRVITQEELFSGNRETLRSVADPDWIPWWVIRTFWKRRRAYSKLLREPGLAGLHVLEFRKPSDAEQFLGAALRARSAGRE